MEKQNAKIVAVIGMHRSGTSVIARGLQVLGVDLGNKLMPPYEGNNSKGFWEDLDINQLNIEMLHALKSDWHFLTPVQSPDVELLCNNGYLARAVELLQEKTASEGIFGFKDPRVAKLLPFWKQVFRQGQWNVSYVVVIRHPLSVCHSLAKRDGLAFEQSYLLWLEHVIGSLAGTEEQNRVLVDYDHFMQNPATELTRMAEKFHFTVDTAELQKFQDEFLDHRLQHTVYRLNDLLRDTKALPLVQEVYSSLLNSLTDNAVLENPQLKNKVSQWNSEFSRMRSALVFADTLSITLAATTAERDALNSERNKLLRERAELKKDFLAKEQAIQRLKTELLAIYQSRMWRWSQPLRRWFGMFRKPK